MPENSDCRDALEQLRLIEGKLNVQQSQLGNMIEQYRGMIIEQHRWQTEVRSDIRYFKDGVDDIKSELKSFEHNRKQEYIDVRRRIDSHIDNANVAVAQDKLGGIETLKLWLIAIITVIALITGLIKGQMDIAGLGKLLS